MKFIINLLGKWTGFNSIWGALDGYKTKLSGVALVLSGLSILITQVIALPHDLVSIINFVQALGGNSAWLTLLSGLAVLGIGHKAEKAAASTDGIAKPEEPK